MDIDLFLLNGAPVLTSQRVGCFRKEVGLFKSGTRRLLSPDLIKPFLHNPQVNTNGMSADKEYKLSMQDGLRIVIIRARSPDKGTGAKILVQVWSSIKW